MATRETVKAILDMAGETPKPLDLSHVFVHVTPKPNACEHDFKGWREFEDGTGGEQVCTKCGNGAMAHTLSLDF